MILKDFYDNGIYPFEAIVPIDPEYRELGRKMGAERYFESLLSPADVERLEKYHELFMSRITIECRESFIYGFRLATLIMIDALFIPEK